jgi:hypothetical protein
MGVSFHQGVQPSSTLQPPGGAGMPSPSYITQQLPYSLPASMMSPPHVSQKMTHQPGSSPGPLKQQPPSVLASLLQQNRGNAANALSNRPSPKQAQREPTTAVEAPATSGGISAIVEGAHQTLELNGGAAAPTLGQ